MKPWLADFPVIFTEPLFYFDQDSYEVDESAGYVEVRVWRTGTDLSQTASVTVQSRKSTPESARGKFIIDDTDYSPQSMWDEGFYTAFEANE